MAGAFYPATPDALRSLLGWCRGHRFGPRDAASTAVHRALGANDRRLLGLVCPHAGYVYSGPVAAHAYARLSRAPRPDLVVVLGPDHRGAGKSAATSPDDAWETPLGVTRVDRRASDRLEALAPFVRPDRRAHFNEHSIEVHVPFLQAIYGDAVPFLPILVTRQDARTCQRLGDALARALEGRQAVIIASCDFTHYEPAAVATERDRLAIAPILGLDAAGFVQAVRTQGVTCCGPGPIVAMLSAATRLGATQARLLAYGTSADTSGDASSVVGYAAIEVTA